MQLQLRALGVLAMWPQWRRWQAALWYAPHWWLWTISGLAWLWIGVAEASASGLLGPAWIDPALLSLCRSMSRDRSAWDALGAPAGPWLGAWLLMVPAMMFPLVTEPVRIVAFASPWRRRHRAMAAFLGGYTLVWLAFGVVTLLAGRVATFVLQALALPGSGAVADALAAAAGFALAAAWAWTPMRRRALAGCHRTRAVGTTGWRADLDCMHFGTLVGWACVRSCGAAMAALAMAGHGAVAMAALAGLLGMERYRLRRGSRAVGYAMAFAAAAMLMQTGARAVLSMA